MRSFALLSLLSGALLIACSSSSKSSAPATTAPALAPAATIATAANVGAGARTPTPAAAAASRSTPATTPHANEDAVAQAMLLTVSDFPAGWAETPRDTSESPLGQCDQGRPPGQTGRAESGEFSTGGSASIAETVGLFDTAQQAQASLTRIPALGDCVVNAVKGGALDTSEYSVTDASFGPASFPALGDQSQAYRIKLAIKLKNQSGPLSQADAYIDLLYVLSGRAGFQLETSNVAAPFDSGLMQDTASKALAKLRQNLPSR